jgi:1-acyl-sn-glycerol-3-phosphate acyltransferase
MSALASDAVAGTRPSRRALYRLSQVFLWGGLTAWTRARYFSVPDIRGRRGGLLIVSNHQSFLDPPLIGMALCEPIRYLARRSLFGVPALGRLIAALGAEPVSRGAADGGAVRGVMRMLRDGEAVLVFPEGTRTRDGSLGPFSPGPAAIAIRCGVPVLPACVEGAYECWPRTRALPRPGRVAVAFGRAVATEGREPEDLTAELRAEVARLRARLRAYLGRAGDTGV